MELKRIRNLTNRDLPVVYKGQQIVLPKRHEGLDMDADVAAAFLEKYESLVAEADDHIDIGGIYEEKVDDSVWVANATGNPDAPEEVTGRRSEKGKWYPIKVPNPLKEPHQVTRQMKGGMKEVVGKSGLEGLNLLPVTIKVPPYKRIRLPKAVGRWFLSRVNACGTPDCIKSRAPTEFEPDSSWSIDDMRLYLQLIDPGVDGLHLGPDEKKIRHLRTGSGKAGEALLQKKLREAKTLLLKRIFFRVVDPRYELPTKAEFEAFKAAMSGKGVDPDPEDSAASPEPQAAA